MVTELPDEMRLAHLCQQEPFITTARAEESFCNRMLGSDPVSPPGRLLHLSCDSLQGVRFRVVLEAYDESQESGHES